MTELHRATLVDAVAVAAAGHRVWLLASRLAFPDVEAVRLGVAVRELAGRLGSDAEMAITITNETGAEAGQPPARLALIFNGTHDDTMSATAKRFFDAVEVHGSSLKAERRLPDPAFDPGEAWMQQTIELLAIATASELRAELERKNSKLEQLLAERAERAEQLKGRNRELQAANAELERLRQREYRLARLDSVTGLPARTLFQDRLQRAIALAQRHGERIAVLFIDLDRFKQLNDMLGHAAGDRALREVGARMTSCIRRSDTVARLGGDEFGVILQELDQAGDVVRVTTKIIEAITAPIAFADREHRLGASIGIAICPDHGEAPDELTERADKAMYDAKRAGGSGWCFVGQSPNAGV